MALHHGVNALLVDDDMRTNQAHLARLEADGYAVALVTDPVVALALIEEVHPSVVFVGLTREVASLEFLQGLKSSRLSTLRRKYDGV